MIVLRTGVGMLPGGIRYEDPRIPAAQWKDDHTFLADRTREVIKFRLANQKTYPEVEWTQYHFVAQQIVDFNAQRMSGNSLFGQYFMEGATVQASPVSVPGVTSTRKCPECGGDLSPKFCPTCSGQKITSYECKSCKKEFPK
jgi:hypothetical protein